MRKIDFQERTDFEEVRYRILLDYIVQHSDEYNMVPAPIILNEALYQMEYFLSLPDHTYDVWDCIHDCMENIQKKTRVQRYSRQTPGYVTVATLYILLNLEEDTWYIKAFVSSIAKVLTSVSTYHMFTVAEALSIVERIINEEEFMPTEDIIGFADEPLPQELIDPFDTEEEPESPPFGTLQPILDALNNHTYTDLDEYLKEEVDWFAIKPEDIVPREKVRAFTKAITNKETRLEVIRFLRKYEDHYFSDIVIPGVGYDEYERPIDDWEHVTILHSIADFHKELSVLIDQLTSHEFSDEKFANQAQRIIELEQKVKCLEEDKADLGKVIEQQKAKIEELEHPESKQFIPDALDEPEFLFIMEYLAAKKIVTTITYQTGYGPRPLCYVWANTAPKTLFGYLVDRVSHELDIRKNSRLDWKLFKPAFRNYDEIIKQAKDAVSKYKFWSDPQDELPKNHHLVEEAIDYAEQKMDEYNISARKRR